MNDQVGAWEDFVDSFIKGNFTHEDLIEIDVSLTNRLEIERQLEQLTGEEKTHVDESDELFRERAAAVLESIGLLEAYRKLGADAPAEEWWWHL